MAIHDNFVDLMDRLVGKNGRAVEIRRQTGSTLKDVSRPELGSVEAFSNTSVKAVFLDNDLRDLLLLIPGAPDQRSIVEREIDRLCMIPGKGLAFEIDVSHTIVDGDKVWEITQVIKIQPGPTLVGYLLQLSN